MESTCELLGTTVLPPFSGTRIMMMPVQIGRSLPPMAEAWDPVMQELAALVPEYQDQVGYFTIDERVILAGEIPRRPGLYVDGVSHSNHRDWDGDTPWRASRHTGMLFVTSEPGCVVYNQRFKGAPDPDGACEHFKSQLRRSSRRMLRPEEVYWMNATCVQEALPQKYDVKRQLVRLTLPSKAPWFEGFTSSPLGILPTGPTVPQRESPSSGYQAASL